MIVMPRCLSLGFFGLLFFLLVFFFCISSLLYFLLFPPPPLPRLASTPTHQLNGRLWSAHFVYTLVLKHAGYTRECVRVKAQAGAIQTALLFFFIIFFLGGGEGSMQPGCARRQRWKRV